MIRAYDDNGNVVDLVEWEKEIKAKTIDEVIKTLAKSEDTILSDKQYYELMKLKGDANEG